MILRGGDDMNIQGEGGAVVNIGFDELRDTLGGVPPKDAVLYVIQTQKGDWHIAFDYKFMGRWVLISTTGKLVERSDVAFSQRCDSLREDGAA
jgi:hypothetical protein